MPHYEIVDLATGHVVRTEQMDDPGLRPVVPEGCALRFAVPAPAPVTQAEQIHEAVPPEAASTADLHTEN